VANNTLTSSGAGAQERVGLQGEIDQLEITRFDGLR
jgi:hypothetical protein